MIVVFLLELLFAQEANHFVREVGLGPEGEWFVHGVARDGTGAYSWWDGDFAASQQLRQWAGELQVRLQLVFGGGGRWLLLKVDSRPSPTSGAWEEIGPLVEASLAERAIEDPEYWQWKTWLFEQYEVDMSPLLEFAAGALVD